MKQKVAVVDYGVGNTLSVVRALECVGADVVLTDTPTTVRESERLVLPGVGAFADGMQGLRDRGLIESIKLAVREGRPCLGICLGMQMLFDSAEEFGKHEGLGLIPGSVVPVPNTGIDGKKHKIPHIGWNHIEPHEHTRSWLGTILEDTAEGTSFYFVHSFAAVPNDRVHRLADCFYDGRPIAAVVCCGATFGCQFHPEKSGAAGLGVLRAFVRGCAELRR